MSTFQVSSEMKCYLVLVLLQQKPYGTPFQIKGVTFEKGRTLFNLLCNLPVHEMTEKMLFIAVAVNHAITVTLVKPISYSAQENTSTNKL